MCIFRIDWRGYLLGFFNLLAVDVHIQNRLFVFHVVAIDVHIFWWEGYFEPIYRLCDLDTALIPNLC